VQKRLIRWRRIALEAAKQTGRAYVPEISAPLALSVLLASAGENKLMFSEREGKSLSEMTNGFDRRATAVIALVGPEGGWTDDEIGLAREGLWQIVTLGGRTLRAETAGIAALAAIQALWGDWQPS